MTKKSTNIAAIAKKDLESMSQLFVSVFSNSPWNEHWQYNWAYERLNWVYQSQGFVGFVAQDKDITIGAILGCSVPFQGKKGFKIIEFFVATDYQHRGVGTRLLNTIELELEQRNYDFISLLTSKDSAAESFYLKRNYMPNDKLILLRKNVDRI